MQISETTFKKLPDQLKHLFTKLPNTGSDEVLAAFPQAKGQQGDLKGHSKDRQSPNGVFGKFAPANDHPARIESDKSAARFFKQCKHDDEDVAHARFMYCAKASKSDRGAENTHPTVKPTDLMAYLCRMVTPTGGVILDPFMGSGSTGKAAMREGFRFIGIEREAEYAAIARARILAELSKRMGVAA